MFSRIRTSLCLLLSGLLVFTPALSAQQATAGAAPIPPQVLNAHTVFIANGGGSNYFHAFNGGPNRAYNTFYKLLKQTGHYQLVSSPSQADLIFEIRAIAPAVSDGNDDVSYNPQVVLTIRDPKTNAMLWSERANVRALGGKRRRDRQFDQSVAVLVDELAQVTGRPLTAAQTKAIADNSRIPTADKVFVGVAIAGAVAITAFGLHAVLNPKKLTPPPVPPPPTLP
jgi:hypothetical protein